MKRALATLLCFAILSLVLPGLAIAAKRVALVIGNNSYTQLPALEKAVNDASAVAGTLEEIGFTVILGTDLTRRETNRKLADFEANIGPGDTAFFFFAGHGVAVGGDNYLIPGDMPKPAVGEESLVRDEAHSVASIVERVRARGAAKSFFVLDACRDNPFAAEGVRSIGGSRGLTRVDAPSGVFVLFSAGIGQTALDRLPGNDPNPNSVFTRILLPLLKMPGLNHVDIAKIVQEEVSALAATARHLQQPAYYDQIIGNIVLVPQTESTASGASATSMPPSGAAREAWMAVQNSTSPGVLEAFIKEFPETIYAEFAKARLAELMPAIGDEARRKPPAADETTIASLPDSEKAPGEPPSSPLMVAGPLGERAIGDPNAPVTIIEYASMTCSHCAHFQDTIYPSLKENYIDTGKVRFIFREFPLDALATSAFMLARCLPEDQFFSMIDRLFRQQRNWAFTDDPAGALLNISKQFGFTQQSFSACLTDQEILDGVNWVKARATTQFDVGATPTFFINGKKVNGAISFVEIQKEIDPLL